MRRRVFVSLVAQSENLGDLVIRRNAINGAFPNHKVVALTTGMPESYLRAYGLEEGSLCVESPIRFQWMLFTESIRGKAHLLIAPGPVVLSNKPLRLLKATIVLSDSILVRLGGGQVSSVGRSYRGAIGIAQIIERLQRRVASTYFVRDHESQSVVGQCAQVRPDMAFFGSRTRASGARNIISVSLREAGPHLVEQLVELKKFADEHGIELVLVTQVKFDDVVHKELASCLGISHISWDNRSHSEQLEEISGVYSRSLAVVSNRLHALIFGLQSGAAAVPVNLSDHPKLVSTLAGRMPFAELTDLLAERSDILTTLATLRSTSELAWQQTNTEIIQALGGAPGERVLSS